MKLRVLPLVLLAAPFVVTLACEHSPAAPSAQGAPAMASAQLSASGGPAAGAAVAPQGRENIMVNMHDACDPDSFNAAIGAGTCLRNGGVSFDQFVADLTAHGSAGAWHFARHSNRHSKTLFQSCRTVKRHTPDRQDSDGDAGRRAASSRVNGERSENRRGRSAGCNQDAADCRIKDRSVSSRVSGDTGLYRTASHDIRNSSSAALVCAVIPTTGTRCSRGCFRISRAASAPSSPGIEKSIRMAAGAAILASSTAS